MGVRGGDCHGNRLEEIEVFRGVGLDIDGVVRDIGCFESLLNDRFRVGGTTIVHGSDSATGTRGFFENVADHHAASKFDTAGHQQ